MAWLVALLDVAIVTAVVAATGGARSMFTFLYVMLVTAACVTLSRTGGLTIAAVASSLYTGLVFGRTVFPLTSLFEVPEESTALEILTMFANAGTFLVVAIVAGGLAERFQSTRAELETQRKDLENLEVFKDLVFQSVETGLVAIDRRHRITAFNRAAAEITGVSATDAMGRTWSSLFGDAVPVGAVETTLDAQPRAISRHELALPRPDGTTAPLRLAFSALRSADGGRLGLIAACEDLTTLRTLESRMRQADRLATLGRMAANIAHEIRNPLASMTGAIEVLVGAERPPEMRERLASIVLRESGRLNEIIKGFLEYARPAPLVPATAEVAECLDEILVLIEHRAAPGKTFEEVKESGYLPEDYVIGLATAAGFVLEEKSEVNANPADTKDHPNGVWTLPPSNNHPEEERAKYAAIGESDRMTLRFVKPNPDAAPAEGQPKAE